MKTLFAFVLILFALLPALAQQSRSSIDNDIQTKLQSGVGIRAIDLRSVLTNLNTAIFQQITNASGSTSTATGSVAAGSSNLVLTGSWDIRVGEGVWVPGAGTANTAGVPTIGSVTSKCSKLVTATIAGTITPGDTATLTFNGLSGTPTSTYTVVSGDTLSTIADGLAAVVNANRFLNANAASAGSNIVAVASSAVINLNYPSSLVTLSSISGGTSGGATITNTISGPTGCTTTVNYQLAGRDAAGGMSAASSVTAATTSAPAASLKYSRAAAYMNSNTVAFTPGANDIDVVVYRNGSQVAVVPAADGLFTDVGQSVATGLYLSPDIPQAAPASARAAPLITTAIGVNGVDVSLGASAINAVAAATIYHDDGAAIQAALSASCVLGAPSPFITLGRGQFNTHQTLSCVGSNSHVVFVGNGGIANKTYQVPATLINYWGRGDLALFYTDGLNVSTISGISFDGSFIAKYAIQTDNSNASTMASDNIFLDHIFAGFVNSSTGSASYSAGHPGCSSSVEIGNNYLIDSYLQADSAPGASRNNFIALCSGNVKNFIFDNSVVVGSRYGFEATLGSSGLWDFHDVVTANIADTTFHGVAGPTFNVVGGEYENQNHSVVLDATAGPGPCNIHISGMHWGTVAPVPGDFAFLVNQCGLNLSSSAFLGSESWEYGIASAIIQPASSQRHQAVYSTGNFFAGSESLPLFDVYGQRIATAGPAFQATSLGNMAGAGLLSPVPIYSFGDYGGVVNVAITTFPTLDLFGGTKITNFSYVINGISNAAAAQNDFLDIYGGGAHIIQWTTPSAPNIINNTSGSTTFSYKVAFRDASGQHSTPLSAAATTATSNATPNNQVYYPATLPPGAYYMDIVDSSTVGGPYLLATINATQFNFVYDGLFWLIQDVNLPRTVVYTPVARNNTGDITVDGLVTMGGALATAAAPTAAAGQIGYGSTTVAAGAGTCPSGTVGGQTVLGCIVVNIAGTSRNVPFF